MRTLGFGWVLLGTVVGLALGCGESEAGAGANHGGAGAGAATAGANTTTGGQADAQAGTGNAAGSSAALVDCDPKKILCKRLAPECAAGEVPSVEGSCYGDCVKIDGCRCAAAAECPEPEQYTCWAQQHCGPFVQ